MNKKPKDGFIFDFISKIEVEAKREEVEAVQPFSKELVELYKYPKKNIRTRPQYRVRARPEGSKSYPVDIIVFNGSNHSFENEYLIVECKKKKRKDGLKQLQDYLTFSKAQLGVWYNGEEKLYLRKIIGDGNINFEEIPNIPEFGKRVEDIGKFKRRDLQTTHNLKSDFKTIRNYLAGNASKIKNDLILSQQLINLIFCKIYDELNTAPDEDLNFRAGTGENPEKIKDRIYELFNKVKKKYDDVFDNTDNLILDAKSVAYVVGDLQNKCLVDAERDIIAEAFEVFIGKSLKGEQGQFFTPRNVIRMMIEVLDPKENEKIIDPACGTGGFLVESLRYVWNKIDEKGKKNKWSINQIENEKNEVAKKNISGMDDDVFLTKVAKAYMAILGDGRSGTFSENSLDKPDNWDEITKSKVKLNSFDILLTNPPFGSKIKVEGESILQQYDLGHKWKQNSKNQIWEKGKLKESESPQIIFIERCLDLLKENGKMAIVLPDGIFGNETLSYLRNWIIKKAKILAVIDIPLETFLPHTGTKTSILVLKKTTSEEVSNDYKIFMAVADYCGHDRRGYKINEDDLPLIPKRFHYWFEKHK